MSRRGKKRMALMALSGTVAAAALSDVAAMPEVGAWTEYRLTEQDVNAINKRMDDFRKNWQAHREKADGSVCHIGNNVSVGEVFPMLIVKVWAQDCVNGQVFLDGNHTYWATSVSPNLQQVTEESEVEHGTQTDGQPQGGHQGQGQAQEGVQVPEGRADRQG